MTSLLDLPEDLLRRIMDEVTGNRNMFQKIPYAFNARHARDILGAKSLAHASSRLFKMWKSQHSLKVFLGGDEFTERQAEVLDFLACFGSKIESVSLIDVSIRPQVFASIMEELRNKSLKEINIGILEIDAPGRLYIPEVKFTQKICRLIESNSSTLRRFALLEIPQVHMDTVLAAVTSHCSAKIEAICLSQVTRNVELSWRLGGVVPEIRALFESLPKRTLINRPVARKFTSYSMHFGQADIEEKILDSEPETGSRMTTFSGLAPVQIQLSNFINFCWSGIGLPF